MTDADPMPASAPISAPTQAALEALATRVGEMQRGIAGGFNE